MNSEANQSGSLGSFQIQPGGGGGGGQARGGGGGGGGVLNKVSYEEVPPRGPTPNHFTYHFWQKRALFRIPSIAKWYSFHIPS